MTGLVTGGNVGRRKRPLDTVGADWFGFSSQKSLRSQALNRENVSGCGNAQALSCTP